MKLYVGNLIHTTTDLQLGALFGSHGSVVSVRIVHDHFTRQSKGFGYVVMSNREEGCKALSKLHGKKVNDQSLIVKEARSRDERQGCRW